MIYSGTTTCRWCGASFTFECFNLTSRARLSAGELADVEAMPSVSMHYDYTDEDGVPHFSGECKNCHRIHELYPAEAKQIPREFYSWS